MNNPTPASPTAPPAPTLESTAVYFLGMNYVHATALRDNARRDELAANIAEAVTETELRRALQSEWLHRQELQSKIGMQEYISARVAELVRPIYRDTEADAELRFGLVLQDPDAPAETVNAAMREWREIKGYVYEEAPHA